MQLLQSPATPTTSQRPSMIRRVRQSIRDSVMAAYLTLRAFTLSVVKAPVAVRMVKKVDDVASMNIQGAILGMVGLLVVILLFAALAPSIAGGLNNTTSAFTGFPGASSIITIIPILLVVSVVVFLVLRYRAG